MFKYKFLNKEIVSCLQKKNFSSYSISKYPFLKRLGLEKNNIGCFNGKEWKSNGKTYKIINPSNNDIICNVTWGNENDYNLCIDNMEEVKKSWQLTPTPKRGEIVRDIAQSLRENKEDLGSLISLEMGKILEEGIGEVQEFIDMADMAVGMSRQLPGQILPSFRKYWNYICI